jgi:hypothetical protein
MRRDTRSKLTWGITVAALLWFVEPIGAIPLESWDDKIPNAGNRFKVLSEFGGLAVLDNETGLVWEQSPATTIHSWYIARSECTRRITGGRKGWRLPSVHELASLIDPSVPSPGPVLPPGHPFLNVQASHYWSASSDAGNPEDAWFVYFFNGALGGGYKANIIHHVWCVRGGMNADQY